MRFAYQNAYQYISQGYIPTNLDRREMVLKRKRDEYWHYVEQYFHTRYDEQHQTTFRQVFEDLEIKLIVCCV